MLQLLPLIWDICFIEYSVLNMFTEGILINLMSGVSVE